MRAMLKAAVFGAAVFGAAAPWADEAAAADSFIGTCLDKNNLAPYCSAVRGDRHEGWLGQTRSEIMAQRGVVATSEPLAAQAGLQILMNGGNAIDAAVATAAALNVTEPMMVGIAGDLFAIVYIASEKKLYTLNASGKAPTGQTLKHMNNLGYKWDPQNWSFGSGMPRGGILTVTVPGAAWGWDEILQKHGTMKLSEVMAPAVKLARDGYPVSQRIAVDWVMPNAYGPEMSSAAKCCTQKDPDSVKAWLPGGKAPVPGQIFRNPELARTLELYGEKGRDVFYKGEIAEAIVKKSKAAGGTMTMKDLADYSGEWVEAAQISLHGYEFYQLPPPAQSWAALEALNIFEACVPTWTGGKKVSELDPASAQYHHLAVETKKVAYADLLAFNGDPNFEKIDLKKLLSKEYAASLCGKVDPNKAAPAAPRGKMDGEGDTIVMTVGDKWGNMVSWVNSNTSVFGSGLTVPEHGFILHNRGVQFTLDPKSPNVIAPHKRPFNTLAAGFVMKGMDPVMAVTLMGGDMQAQGHFQVLTNMFDFGANLQAATDMARWYHNQVTNELYLESELRKTIGPQMEAMGHILVNADKRASSLGGYQALMFTPVEGEGSADPNDPRIPGFYRAGSDHRKDGHAVGY